MRKPIRVLIVALLATVALLAAGCSRTRAVSESRQALGTAIQIDVYPKDADTEGTKIAVDRAFSAISGVEHALSPYDESSAIAKLNSDPYSPRKLPADALEVIDRVQALAVRQQFSPALFGVTNLYDFGGKGSVPATGALGVEVDTAASFHVQDDGTAAFGWTGTWAASRPAIEAIPGLDFGGASKGLAIDRAAAVLQGLPALITAGSSTYAIGSKPDGEPWRIGIEDPRAAGQVLAVVSAEGTLSVSTSGDYQTYFERDGVRYHHILDPATGMPARGLRSLAVFGRLPALDADILSTALFVMGREDALAYARAHGVGVYLVDDAGTPASFIPKDTGVTLKTEADPTR